MPISFCVHACWLKLKNILRDHLAHPRTVQLRKAFGTAGFQDPFLTLFNSHHHRLDRTASGRMLETLCNPQLFGGLIRLSYQRGFSLATNAPGTSRISLSHPVQLPAPQQPTTQHKLNGLPLPLDRIHTHLRLTRTSQHFRRVSVSVSPNPPVEASSAGRGTSD